MAKRRLNLKNWNLILEYMGVDPKHWAGIKYFIKWELDRRLSKR